MNKLHASIVPGKPYPDAAEDRSPDREQAENTANIPSVRVEVYLDDEYLGKKIFSQERVIIGRSIEADLVLSDERIASCHASISFIENKPVILDQSKEGLFINGSKVQIAIIETAEQVGIGPFTLKITDLNKTREVVSFDFQPDTSVDSAPLINEKEELPDDVEYLDTDIICDFKTTCPEETPDETESASYTEVTELCDEPEQGKSEQKEPEDDSTLWQFFGAETEDEEDEEDEDLPADFYLKNKINNEAQADDLSGEDKGIYLEVLKLKGERLVDIRHLDEGEKFYIHDNRDKRFCLSEFKNKKDIHFYFNESISGRIENENSSAVETQSLMNDAYCINKRKKIFRANVPRAGRVEISDSLYTYQLRMVKRSIIHSPEPVKKQRSYRPLGISFTFHIVFLLFLGLFPSFDVPEKPEDETRFVQLDSTQLKELEKIVTPKPKPQPPVKPAAAPPAKKIVKSKKVKEQQVRTASSKKKPSKKKSEAASDSHPDAGGGFGVGNVKTRNINETGILSMLSDTVGIQPQNALAAVTNLDAVSSPNVTAANLTVGGVVGKIGTGEISVPKGGIVATMGSEQVLRSHGRKGEGRVAALEKGKTGDHEVMGMVTATIDKTARIRGGLSMDAVKRVIDQHLDDITYCYETELISNPSIVGKVLFEWKILLSGEVGEVRIKSSSINSHEIHECIRDAIRSWQFPQPRGSEVVVSYPFVFDIVGF